MELPPDDTPPKLKSYLSRILQRFDSALQDNFKMPLLTVVPDKPIIGKQYYFKNAIVPSITAEGVWVYKSTGWSQCG